MMIIIARHVVANVLQVLARGMSSVCWLWQGSTCRCFLASRRIPLPFTLIWVKWLVDIRHNQLHSRVVHKPMVNQTDLLSQECIDCLKYEPTHQAEGKLCEQARFAELKTIVFCVWPFFYHNILLQSVLLTPIVRDEQCQLAGLMASVKARMAPWLYQEVKELQMMLNTGIKNYRTLWVDMILLSDQYVQNLNHLEARSNVLGFKCVLFLAF